METEQQDQEAKPMNSHAKLQVAMDALQKIVKGNSQARQIAQVAIDRIGLDLVKHTDGSSVDYLRTHNDRLIKKCDRLQQQLITSRIEYDHLRNRLVIFVIVLSVIAVINLV